MRKQKFTARGTASGRSRAQGPKSLVVLLGLFMGAAPVALADATQVRLEVGLGVATPISVGLQGVPSGPDKLIPVPDRGLEVELWADPAAGSVVYAGDRAYLHFRANADCYVTVFSVDTEGRVRLLYPGVHDDGFVSGRATYRLPTRGSGHNLVFAGPPGIEYVYAVASFEPMRHRYPHWLVDGRLVDPDPAWWDGECDVWDSGWVVGDPFYRIRRFCEQLVPASHRPERFASAYLFWHLGRRVSYPRYLCSDCHGGGWVDPYGPACSAVQIHAGNIRSWGWIDFRVVFSPCYTYEVWRTWRPRHWRGNHWNGPDGRWVWSSRDHRSEMRGHFRDAWGDRRADHGGRPSAVPGDRERSERPELTPWGRSHEERIDRAVRQLREEREVEARRGDKPRNENRPDGVEPREPRTREERPDGGRPERIEPRKEEDRSRGDREVRGGKGEPPRPRPEGRGSQDRGAGKGSGEPKEDRSGARDGNGRDGRSRSR